MFRLLKDRAQAHRSRLLRLLVLVALLTMAIAPAAAQMGETFTNETFTQIYERVSPSVVSISVIARSPGSGFAMEQTRVAGGTGFVLDNSGHIMTNHHVVEGALEVEVSFFDGTLAAADVIGLDPDSDLAVLRVDLPQEDLDALQPVSFGDSSALRVGQTVLAIGSPFGKRWTLTSGIVSAIERSIPGLEDFSIGGVIQTDAAINPGNSGGPLIDLNGIVVGVNSQIISASGASAGIGFAVPSNLASRVAQALVNQGYVNYSFLGVNGVDVYLPLIQEFDLPNDTQGFVVLDTTMGGPAAQAGIQRPTFPQTPNNPRMVPQSVDIITAIDGMPITGVSELIGYLSANTRPGDTVTMDVLRLTQDGIEEMQFDVTLTPRP